MANYTLPLGQLSLINHISGSHQPGIIIPILVAFVVDLYIILPIQFSLDPSMTPRIRVVDTWALGLIYGKIALHAVRIQPPNRIARGFQHVSD